MLLIVDVHVFGKDGPDCTVLIHRNVERFQYDENTIVGITNFHWAISQACIPVDRLCSPWFLKYRLSPLFWAVNLLFGSFF